jgi:hypothetical protein
VFERFEWIRFVLGGGGLSVVSYQLSKGVRTAMVERSRRKTTLAIMDRLIERERQLGQPGPQLNASWEFMLHGRVPPRRVAGRARTGCRSG